MDFRTDPLWIRIDAYQIDDPDAYFPLSSSLAKEQGWSVEFTQRAFMEYKKFIYLCCILPGGASPSKIVDEVWHLHLTYTRDYWGRFCKDTLQKDIHHHPSKGGPDEQLKHEIWYQETLQQYEATFGEPAPADIWSADTIPTPTEPIYYQSNIFFEPGNIWRYALLVLPIIFIYLIYDHSNPYKLSGPHFLVFYALLLGVVALIIYLSVLGKENKLAAILKRDYPELTRYEMAYLSGSETRYALLVIAELVEEKALEFIANKQWSIKYETIYTINYDQLKKSDSPLKSTLLEYGLDTIMLAKIKELSVNSSGDIRRKYAELKKRFEKDTNNLSPVLLVIIMAVIRIFQGISNDKPVETLVVMTLIFSVMVISSIRSFNFFKACNKIIKTNFQSFLGDKVEYGNEIIIYGISAIAGMGIFSHLQRERWLMPNGNGPSDGASCGSGGCSGGGGCGGGCGGCGGD